DRSHEANLPRGPSLRSTPQVLRPGAARHYALSNWQTKTPAAKTIRRTNLRHANQRPYFRGRLPTMRAQRTASESGSDHIPGFATRRTVTATATNAQKRLRPATVLRHLAKKAHANMSRTRLPARQPAN